MFVIRNQKLNLLSQELDWHISGNVVVRACPEALNYIGLVAAQRGHQQDWNIASVRIRFQLPAQLNPVDSRHHHVADDQVGLGFAQQFRPFAAVTTLTSSSHKIALNRVKKSGLSLTVSISVVPATGSASGNTDADILILLLPGNLT